MNSVSGLQSALLKYSSDKIKERSHGLEQIREIFSNRENLLVFQETASKDGGAGWLAFFQCLFQVVSAEKKATIKKGAGASGPADRRLAEAISLVRWMTDRTVYLLSRKPFMALFTHMVHLLVYGSSIFPPAALDYAKALRSLLSYTPHLDNLDQQSWKTLMGICWSSVLGDDMRLLDQWEEDESDDEEATRKLSKRSGEADTVGTQAGPSSTSTRYQPKATITQHNIELISLIPILLSSPAAPLIPPMPTTLQPIAHLDRVGHSILLKIDRFFSHHPSETSAHLTILRSLNAVLAELELNCRDDFLAAGLKLLPHLVALWATRNKAVREQLVIALRLILPFVTHKTLVESKQAVVVRDALEKLVDYLPKETTYKWGVEPLDLGVLRIRTNITEIHSRPFELRTISAGFDFNHEHAMTWAILELYRDACFYLYDVQHASVPPTPGRGGTIAKRRRVENAFSTLLTALEHSSTRSRLLTLQVMIFLVDRYWDKLHLEGQADVRRGFLELLDDEDEAIQSWAFVGVSVLVQLSQEESTKGDSTSFTALQSPSEHLARRKAEEGHWKKAWAHALRKSSSAPVCRAACYTAATLMRHEQLDHSLYIKDIHALLQNVDVQGPIFPYDSVCAFLSLALQMARSDVRLYALELENKVLAWLEKCALLDGPRGKGRMEQVAPADILRLFSAIAQIEHTPLCDVTAIEVLPDAAIVDRILEETKTKPIRDFLLYGCFPSPSAIPAKQGHSAKESKSGSGESFAFLKGRPRRISTFLLNEQSITASDLEVPNVTANAPERIRRFVDLAVLSLSFQASLQLNGLAADTPCVQAAIRLLIAVQPSLLSPAWSIPVQHLIWRGFAPLMYCSTTKADTWPILVRPDVQSGIRQDLLSAAQYDSAINIIDSVETGGSDQDHNLPSQMVKGHSQIPASGQSVFPPTPITSSLEPSTVAISRTTDLVRMIWHLPTVAAAGKDLFSSCLKLVSKTGPVTVANGTQTNLPVHIDNDDFGEIRTAETDAMPLSKEALECQRTSASLLDTAISLRLQGFVFVSKSVFQKAYKDPSLLNALLQAEGERFIEIGSAICDAVHRGWLKLHTDAVELIITSLEEMLRSYAYSRHEGLQKLAIDFARCSSSVWLEVDEADLELQERAVYLVCFLAGKVRMGIISSWRVRLAILEFLDDLLILENAVLLWQRAAEEDDVVMDEDEGSGPSAYLSDALLDIDMRVRIRAATSATSVFYRPVLTSLHDQSQSFYFSALQKQPGADGHWDSFISHMLWKLNVCVASAQQRAAAVFHLYEIPAICPTYNHHLQHGLEAVATRLGLDSVSALYSPYALVIIRSQLREGQMAMRIPHKLYGYPSRKAFSAACLTTIGPAILSIGEIDFYNAACEAAGIQPQSSVAQHFPAAAALIFCNAFGTIEQHGMSQDACAEAAMKALLELPGMEDRKKLEAQFDEELDNIAAHLWESLDLKLSIQEIAEYLDTVSLPGQAFQEVMTNDSTIPGTVVAVDPSSSVSAVVAAYTFLKGRKKPSLDLTKMVFSALLRLTHRINHVFLVSEQRRYLRALALLSVIHSSEMRNSAILETYLRETLALLSQPDICGIVLSMVAWGFDQVSLVKESLKSLTDLFIRLGTAHSTLSTNDNAKTQEVRDSLEIWIINSAPAWTSAEPTRVAFEAALALWPASLRERLSTSYIPLFVDLRMLSENSNVKQGSELCAQYYELIRSASHPRSEAISTFVQSLFWHLKGKLGKDSDTNQDGIKAFLDILYQANGQVHAPPLTAMRSFSKHQLTTPPVPTAVRHGSRSTAPSPKPSSKELRARLVMSVVREVVRLTDSARQETRAMAYRVLQGMLPMITDEVQFYDKSFQDEVRDKLSVLIPTGIPPLSSNKLAARELLGKLSDPGWIKHSRSVDKWSGELVKVLSELVSVDDDFYRSLEPLISSPTIPLRDLLPHLVRASLTCTFLTASPTKQQPAVTSERSVALSEHFTMVVQWPSASTETIQSILDIFLYLRYFLPPFRPTNDALAYNSWLNMDYLVLSRAAVKAGAYASALLFLELARDQERPTPVELSESNVQNVMYEIYSNVEDPDGFYGIQNHDVRDALLRRLRHEGQTSRAFGWNGAAIEVGSGPHSQLLLPALHNLHDFGFNRLASAIAGQSRRQGADEIQGDPFFYELAWRTGDWDLPSLASNESASESQSLLYASLRAVHRERDAEEAMRIVNVSLGKEMDKLARLSMEQMAQVKKTTSNLLCLKQVADWLEPTFQGLLDVAQADAKGLKAFANLDKLFDFGTAEKMTATKLSLLRAGRERETQHMIGDLTTPRLNIINTLEKQCRLRLGEMARENRNLQASVNAITAVQRLENGNTSDEAQDAFSHVLWAQGEHALAIQHVGEMVEDLGGKKSKNGARLAVLLGRIAHWTSLAKLKAAHEIKLTFDDAHALAKLNNVSHDEHANLCHTYASFADGHYTSLNKSSELDRLKAYHSRKSSELRQMEATLKSSHRRESSSRGTKAAQEVEEDAQAIQELENERRIYIKTSLRMYASAFTLSNSHDDSITRLCSLWLEHDNDEDVNKDFASYLRKIPSYKFIFLGPQLAARLYKPPQPTHFNSTLNGLMLRMSREHPYHILYQVITLAHGVSPPTSASSSARRKSGVTGRGDEGRGPAAAEILAILALDSTQPLSQKGANHMKLFTDASIAWAHYQEPQSSSANASQSDKTKPKAGSVFNLPTSFPFKNLRLDIPIATSPPEIDVTCKYQGIPTFIRYKTAYTIAGGVHRPRIMRCYDSKGKVYGQLFKAEDEVRQDAVMEQVFNMTNDLLSRDRHSKARDLRFRTYNVVPLPERTGIIEFVEGTKGIGEWLKPAHSIYRPKDLHPTEFQKRISDLQDKDPNSSDLVRKYQKCMETFKPVFRHFFTEKHRDPLAWFMMRLNYSRSLAVTSIVGWMVGLGDRHCSNILIDQTNGELVHIDFGIVFEDGRKLRIPEKVPFRLTNDLVDALGISGVEGTFRQCSSHTLRVLRDSSDLILTVLEVFKHDPLYAWSGDPDKLQRLQGGAKSKIFEEDPDIKEKADRVLNKIRGKLGSELSVEYTVNMLIQQARDVESLAKIYHGWASWF